MTGLSVNATDGYTFGEMNDLIFQPGQVRTYGGWWTMGHLNDQIRLKITKITDLNGNLPNGASQTNSSNGPVKSQAASTEQAASEASNGNSGSSSGNGENEAAALQRLEQLRQKAEQGNVTPEDAAGAINDANAILQQAQSQ